MRMLARLFTLSLLLMAAQKPLFMLCNRGAMEGLTIGDCLAVKLHALPLDVTVAAYIAALPWLLLFVAALLPKAGKAVRALLKGYCAVVGVLMAVVGVADAVLYRFWDYKIDASVFTYLDKPGDAAASVSTAFLLLCLGATAAMAAAYVWLYFQALRPSSARSAPQGQEKDSSKDTPLSRRLLRFRTSLTVFLFLLSGGLLFVGIRGGVGTGTANVSRVYFSDKQFLNHSAVNPMFNLLYSTLHRHRFDKEFRFMGDEECLAVATELYRQDESARRDTLLETSRPNILLVIWEGCGANMVETLGGAPGVTPCFDALAAEGMLFTECHANGFRTDRGVMSVMSGWPCAPTASVMKMQEKCNRLPGLARALKENGYATDFWYGGDIGFTNTGGYLMASGIEKITADKDFSLAERHYSKWGVADGVVADRMAREIAARGRGPWFSALLTLSSHEPWEVPYSRLDDEKRNAFAYTDSCLGRLAESLKASGAWDDMLLVVTADHGVKEGSTSAQMAHIPLLLTGGALKGLQRGRRVDTIMNQSDIAATLLAQLGISHREFFFSRDVMADDYRPSALHANPNELVFIDPTGRSSYEFAAEESGGRSPEDSLRLHKAKAALQTLYNKIAGL